MTKWQTKVCSPDRYEIYSCVTAPQHNLLKF